MNFRFELFRFFAIMQLGHIKRGWDLIKLAESTRWPMLKSRCRAQINEDRLRIRSRGLGVPMNAEVIPLPPTPSARKKRA